MHKAGATAEQFKAYRAMFSYFNKILFANELPEVILNFSRHAGSYGFFAPERWSRAGGQIAHEISINPAHLASRDPRDTAATLVHEMCHLWQHVLGTPPRRGYHDREWASQMLRAGLTPICPKSGEHKMSAHKLTHKITDGGPFARAFERMPREYVLPWTCSEVVAIAIAGGGKGGQEGEEGEEGSEPKPRNKIKYSCPQCDINVWGKPNLSIRCGICETPFASVV